MLKMRLRGTMAALRRTPRGILARHSRHSLVPAPRLRSRLQMPRGGNPVQASLHLPSPPAQEALGGALSRRHDRRAQTPTQFHICPPPHASMSPCVFQCLSHPLARGWVRAPTRIGGLVPSELSDSRPRAPPQKTHYTYY